ncbi:hypothetical protein IMZ48_46945 [Candidatus Bathyarchaeota archaeon]|nr:hypothetical protein [Candidatus Bathyarchaeota archaeon]
MFQHNFAENPRSREAWGKFRTEILECGGSRDELEMLTKFLGRAPTTDAFLTRLGLANAS